MFWESGFGVIANYTTVEGDISYDNFQTNKTEGAENQFALLGLSDSANFVAFYDKHGLQARVAYNWRDDFLTNTLDGNGERNPIYTEDYGQWDVNMSYEVTDNLTLIAEGINITEETRRQYGRHENMVILAIEQGARYAVGARYTF
jgi:TonB-dependent receptor